MIRGAVEIVQEAWEGLSELAGAPSGGRGRERRDRSVPEGVREELTGPDYEPFVPRGRGAREQREAPDAPASGSDGGDLPLGPPALEQDAASPTGTADRNDSGLARSIGDAVAAAVDRRRDELAIDVTVRNDGNHAVDVRRRSSNGDIDVDSGLIIPGTL